MTARSISAASRTLTGLDSTPSDGATAWMAANWPIPAAMAGSRKTAARVTSGAIWLEQLQPFPAHAVFEHREAGGVAARPRQAVDETGADRIGDDREHDRHGAGRLQQRRHGRGASTARMTSGASAANSAACLRMSSGIGRGPARVDPHVAADGPAQLLQPLQERCDAGLILRIVRGSRPSGRRCAASARPAARAPRAATPPPRRQEAPRNSRRCMSAPKDQHRAAQTSTLIGAEPASLPHHEMLAMSALGQKRTSHPSFDVRFTPNSGHQATGCNVR